MILSCRFYDYFVYAVNSAEVRSAQVGLSPNSDWFRRDVATVVMQFSTPVGLSRKSDWNSRHKWIRHTRSWLYVSYWQPPVLCHLMLTYHRTGNQVALDIVRMVKRCRINMEMFVIWQNVAGCIERGHIDSIKLQVTPRNSYSCGPEKILELYGI